MPLTNSSLNGTQKGEVLVALFEDTASSVVPSLLMESFTLGMLCASVPLGSYLIWIKLRSIARVSFIAVSWISLTAMITHWALSLRHFESLIHGRTLLSDYDHAKFNETDDDMYFLYGVVGQFVLPLVTETVLLGFGTLLFAILAYSTLWRRRSQWFAGSASIIPVLAVIMYAVSLAHWAAYLRYYGRLLSVAQRPDSADERDTPTYIALVILLSVNIIMSDAIVLWRMCVVWDNNRAAIAFGAALIVSTLALNVANIALIAIALFRETTSFVFSNVQDSEILVTYGLGTVGLAAAFVSLASNVCATGLVGLKTWLYRRRIADQVRTNGGRTTTERLLELLVDSGTCYTAVWVLYCVSFFKPITSYSILEYTVTAVDHLDTAMAQITSIYPLIIFIFMALDKTHHSRGPRALRESEWSEAEKEDGFMSANFEVDIERSAILVPYSMVELRQDS